MRGLRLVTRHLISFGSLFTLRPAVHHHLGELICLVSTFPVNLYFINPPAPGEEEGAAKSEEGIRTVPPDIFGVGAAGVAGTLTLVGWILRIRGIVADSGIEALDLMGGRGVEFSFSTSTSFLVCLGAETRRVISLGRAGRIMGDYHQLDLYHRREKVEGDSHD
jgi:hypothetical protein